MLEPETETPARPFNRLAATEAQRAQQLLRLEAAREESRPASRVPRRKKKPKFRLLPKHPLPPRPAPERGHAARRRVRP